MMLPWMSARSSPRFFSGGASVVAVLMVTASSLSYADHARLLRGTVDGVGLVDRDEVAERNVEILIALALNVDRQFGESTLQIEGLENGPEVRTRRRRRRRRERSIRLGLEF